jgi:hypothetical protein
LRFTNKHHSAPTLYMGKKCGCTPGHHKGTSSSPSCSTQHPLSGCIMGTQDIQPQTELIHDLGNITLKSSGSATPGSTLSALPSWWEESPLMPLAWCTIRSVLSWAALQSCLAQLLSLMPPCQWSWGMTIPPYPAFGIEAVITIPFWVHNKGAGVSVLPALGLPSPYAPAPTTCSLAAGLDATFTTPGPAWQPCQTSSHHPPWGGTSPLSPLSCWQCISCLPVDEVVW